MPKSNKQKCLEMWEWLAANPGTEKYDYADQCIREGRPNDYYFCWACATAWVKTKGLTKVSCIELPDVIDNSICSNCPIDFPKVKNGIRCISMNSPYYHWFNDQSTEHAEAMVKLIKETWED
ncbi:MAG: hypothetical protein PF440_11935 [Thiomicrorhabdus sp.]|jgi:hypothetical protein|nr:hypothetical protein [Thiomicrorhabdus sp.]